MHLTKILQNALSTPIHRSAHAFPMKRSTAMNALIDPACPACDCMMWISEIEPAKPCYDRRTFVCPRCHQVEGLVVQFRRRGRKERDKVMAAFEAIPRCRRAARS